MQDLIAFIQAQEGSGIVYTHLRATCDWVASGLIDADVDAAAYHAGKSAHVRRSVQGNWADGSLACVVATIVSLQRLASCDPNQQIASKSDLHLDDKLLLLQHLGTL